MNNSELARWAERELYLAFRNATIERLEGESFGMSKSASEKYVKKELLKWEAQYLGISKKSVLANWRFEKKQATKRRKRLKQESRNKRLTRY